MTESRNRSEPYRTRRGLLMEQHEKGLIVVRGQGVGAVNPNFTYLTGLPEPRGVLLLAPAGTRVVRGRAEPGPDYVRGAIVQQVLFLPRRDPLAERWGEDSAATVESVSAESLGVDAVYGTEELAAVLGRSLQAAPRLFYVRAQEPSLDGPDDEDTAWLDRVRRRFVHLALGDATPSLHEMRRLKDADEVRAVERSVAVVAEALDRALARVRPGVLECEIEAEITRTYREHGGVHAFDPIVASGPRALQLHYRDNTGRLEEGELLLVDTGVSIGGYKADITRTWPVGGRYGERQRAVYEAVLEAQNRVIDQCAPDALLGDLHALAWETLEAIGYAERFVHGLGHHLGLETHDVGNVHRPLAAGAVITVEPGVYIPDEEIGIRIEDDVVIVDGGHRVLSDSIAKDPEAVQARMAELAS